MSYAPTRPFTEAEQAAFRETCRRVALVRQTRRAATPSGQDYNRPSTPRLRAIAARLMGEGGEEN